MKEKTDQSDKVEPTQDEPEVQKAVKDEADKSEKTKSSKTFDHAYVKELREESARYRTQAREAEEKLRQLESELSKANSQAEKLSTMYKAEKLDNLLNDSLTRVLGVASPDDEQALKQRERVKQLAKVDADVDFDENFNINGNLADTVKAVVKDLGIDATKSRLPTQRIQSEKSDQEYDITDRFIQHMKGLEKN